MRRVWSEYAAGRAIAENRHCRRTGSRIGRRESSSFTHSTGGDRADGRAIRGLLLLDGDHLCAAVASTPHLLLYFEQTLGLHATPRRIHTLITDSETRLALCHSSRISKEIPSHIANPTLDNPSHPAPPHPPSQATIVSGVSFSLCYIVLLGSNLSSLYLASSMMWIVLKASSFAPFIGPGKNHGMSPIAEK